MWDNENLKSSVTSYILTLNIDIETFSDILYQNYYHKFFERDELKNQIKARIKEYESYHEDLKEEGVEDADLEEEIAIWRKMKDELSGYDRTSIVMMAIELAKIDIEHDEEKITLTFEGLLHYNYVNSLPELMNEIILFFTLHPDFSCTMIGTTNFDLEVL